jgi:hypothetical protein
MRAKLLIRIAAGCLLFFAVGHSIGHSTRRDTTDPKEQETLRVMIENKFDMFGQMRSYDDNYEGMSLNLIFTLLAFVGVLWVLSGAVNNAPSLVRNALIPIGICTVVFAVTAFLYFFLVPAITCVVAGILIFAAVVSIRK